MNETFTTRQEPGKFIDPQGRVRVSDDGDLIINPSIEFQWYPFMPTVTEVLGAYCIQSDLEIPQTVLEMFTDNVRKFCREEWNEKGLKKRIKENERKHGMLWPGNPYELGSFTECVLKDRGMEDIEKEGAYGYYKGICERVANDDSLQKSLETKLPENLRGLLGNSGFKRYLLQSY